MKKICILFLTFFFSYTAHAGLEGFGDIKLSPYSVDQFEKYLSDYNHNKKKGGKEKHGKGLVFSISADGMYSSYYYCFQGGSCTPNEAQVQNSCQISAKKQTGKKIKCNTFAIGRKIVWNNLNRVVPKNIDVKNFLEELDMVSNAKPPKDLDSEQKKQLKSLFEAGIMTKKEYEEALKQIK